MKTASHVLLALALAAGQPLALPAPAAAQVAAPEPPLAVRLEGPLEAMIGRRHAVKVVPKDPAVKLELAQGPPGLALEGTSLVWTPTAADVGTHRVQLRVSAGKVASSREITLTVRRPSIPLGFAATDLRLSPDGTAAVVLGTDADRPRQPLAQGGPSRLAVVDLREQAVAADRKMLVGVHAVAVDGKHVYAGLASSDAFHVLARDDLKELRRIFTSGRVQEFVPVADRLLFVVTQANPQLLAFKLPDLSPAGPADVGAGVHLGPRYPSLPRSAPQPPQRAAAGWYFDGVLYDGRMEKVRAVVQPPGVLAVSPTPTRVPPLPPRAGAEAYPAWLAPWSVTVAGSSFRHGSRVVGTVQRGPFPTPQSVVLSDQPAVATLRYGQEQAGAATAGLRANVVFQDLVSGAPGVQLALVEDPAERPRPAGLDRQPRLHARPGLLVALLGDRVYPVEVPKLDPEKYPVPAHFAVDQPVQVVAGRDVKVPVPPLAGAKEPVEFALRQEVPGVEISKDGRTLAVQAEVVAAKGAEAAAGRLKTGYPARTGARLGPEEALAEYLREAGPTFERLTGRKPQGVPVWLSVGIVARDKNLQTAETDVGLFLDVPADKVRERLKGAEKGAGTPGVPSKPAAEPRPTLQGRVDELERKLKEIDDKLDRLLRLLEKDKQDKPVPKK